MKRIARVGQSLADFQGDYVFKWHLITSSSDIRVLARDLNFSALHLSSTLKFCNEQSRLKAETNGAYVWIRISPTDPYSWFTFLVEPTPQGVIPGIRLKKSFNVFSHTATGIIQHGLLLQLPDLTGKFRWRSGRFKFDSSCTLSGNPKYVVRDFSSALTFQNQYLKTRAALNHTNTSDFVGASIHFLNSEFALTWEKPDLGIAGDFGVGRFWRVAFQTFLWELPSFSLKRKTSFGSINGAMDLSSKHLIGKVKKVTETYELSVIAFGERFGLGDWKTWMKFSVSHPAQKTMVTVFFNGDGLHLMKNPPRIKR
jgi:hypothetical protein